MKQAGGELEGSEILWGYLPEYLKKHKITKQQMKAMRAIENCWTHRMGYHLRECDECG